jgi:hypothetical protein
VQLFRVLLLSLFSASLFGQSASTLIGARAAGLGYASSVLHDEWAVFNNIAGSATLTTASLQAAYDVRPQLEGANRMAFAGHVPLQTGTISAGVFRFGDDVYNEHKLSVGYANKLGLAALGVSANYIQYQALGFGRSGVLTVNLGGIAELTKYLSIGAHIQNINQPKITEGSNERVPTLMAAGLCFTPSQNVTLISEVQKDVGDKATYKVALEYRPVEKFAARTGVNLQPGNFFFGIGFINRRLIIDYAFQYNPGGLASSHQASIGYKLKNK